MEYLGIHTSLGHVQEEAKEKIPFLRENEGKLPPFLIAVGDRRRVADAVKELRLKESVLLHDVAGKLLGRKARGRVDIVIGNFIHNNKPVPIAVFETQMGGSPLQIIAREVLTHTATGAYNHKGRVVARTNRVYVIRAGSAGGINDPGDPQSRVIRVGDVVNATHSIGYSGALIQSLGGNAFFDKAVQEKFWREWRRLGGKRTPDGQFPMMSSDKKVVSAINSAAGELKVRFHEGGNFSKDSLYAESDEDEVIRLRRKHNVWSTEMEHVTLVGVAKEFKGEKNISTGLVSGIVGTVPGGSFAASQEEKAAAARVEGDVLRVAALALWKLAHGKS